MSTQTIRLIILLLLSLLTVAGALASDFDPMWAERLLGKWQSVAISGSGFGAATNALLRCYTAGVGGAAQKVFEAELSIRGADGREMAVRGALPFHASEDFILIGSESRVGFAYLLTNSTLVLYGPKPDPKFKIQLRRIDK